MVARGQKGKHNKALRWRPFPTRTWCSEHRAGWEGTPPPSPHSIRVMGTHSPGPAARAQPVLFPFRNDCLNVFDEMPSPLSFPGEQGPAPSMVAELVCTHPHTSSSNGEAVGIEMHLPAPTAPRALPVDVRFSTRVPSAGHRHTSPGLPSPDLTGSGRRQLSNPKPLSLRLTGGAMQPEPWAAPGPAGPSQPGCVHRALGRQESQDG